MAQLVAPELCWLADPLLECHRSRYEWSPPDRQEPSHINGRQRNTRYVTEEHKIHSATVKDRQTTGKRWKIAPRKQATTSFALPLLPCSCGLAGSRPNFLFRPTIGRRRGIVASPLPIWVMRMIPHCVAISHESLLAHDHASFHTSSFPLYHPHSHNTSDLPALLIEHILSALVSIHSRPLLSYTCRKSVLLKRPSLFLLPLTLSKYHFSPWLPRSSCRAPTTLRFLSVRVFFHLLQSTGLSIADEMLLRSRGRRTLRAHQEHA